MNILSLTYLGNIQWFSKLCFSDNVIDIHENYVKQSFRNRCEILTAAGRNTLTVNVIKPSNTNKAQVRDILIDYSKRWQHQHRHAITSSYGNSPFFEHYWPELEPLFTKKFLFLADLNISTTEKILRLLKSNAELNFSDRYIERGENMTDLRNSISPKPRLQLPDPAFSPRPYWQVFSPNGSFEPNLSILDLLFCEGPNSLSVIRDSILAE